MNFETLKELKRDELIDKCKELGLKGYSRLNKTDLAELILNHQINEENVNTGEKESVNDDSKSKKELENFDNFEKNINRIANTYYDKLYAYTTDLLANKTAFLPSFFEIVSSYGVSLKTKVSTVKKGNDISGNTLKNYHSQIMILIENKVIENNSKFPDNLLLNSFNTFSSSVKNIFSIDFKEAIKTTGNHLNERQNNIIFITCKDLLIFAEETLTKLSDKASDWKKIALSLMIVTGRRLTEIMFTASFSKVDDYHVNFIGQLKGSDYDTKGYVIPTLVNSDLVINGVKWLEFFGKRNDSNFIELVENEKYDELKLQTKLTHGKYARYLNEEIKNILSDYIHLDNQDDWTIIYDDGKQKDRRTTHLCRQIYAQIAYHVFYYQKQVKRKKHQILADIMGHEYSTEKTRTASNNYDADFEVTDYEEIVKIINC